MTVRIPVIIIVVLLGYLPAFVFSIKHRKKKIRGLWSLLLWGIPTLFYLYFFIVLFIFSDAQNESLIHATEWITLVFFSIFVPSTIYLLVYLLGNFIGKIRKKRVSSFSYSGTFLALLFLCSFIVGATNRFDYDVRRVELTYPSLPPHFDGLRIALISDVHLGNLTGAHSFLKQIEQVINQAQPDVICLTGDLVNLTGYEGKSYWPYFQHMKAKIGKYAILGNHDYGDYSHWESAQAKEDNLMRVYDTYRILGFDLLLDDYRCIGQDSDTIGLIGVQNCSKPPFKSYGNLTKVLNSIPPYEFNIVMSHDPNHWTMEIQQHRKLRLTLSGHTHSAQMALKKWGINWSPAKALFPNWDGLYRHQGQYLFVNRGLGYVGLPYRLGTPAEVTIITLRHGNNEQATLHTQQKRQWALDRIVFQSHKE